MKVRPTLGVIPARGGSQGIPSKNIRLLAGQPLIAYTVKAALESGVIDRLILSTDSPEIAQVGRSLGVEVPFLRPPSLADHDTPMLPVIEHAVRELEQSGWSPAAVFILQPTSPLRRPQHLVQALALLEELGCDSVVSVVPVPEHFAPHYVMKIVEGKLFHFLPEGKHITRRQDVIPAYSRDGTVFLVRRDVLVNEHTIYGKDCRSLLLSAEESLNLDTWEDWQRAEQRLAQLQGRES